MSGSGNSATANVVVYTSSGSGYTSTLATELVNFTSPSSTNSGTYVPTSPAGTVGENPLVVYDWNLPTQFSAFLTAVTNGGASIVALGDSTTQGYNATTGGNATQLSYPDELARALSAAGVAAATNNFLGIDATSLASNGIDPVDSRVALFGNAVLSSYASGTHAGGSQIGLLTSGAGLNFTLDNAATFNDVQITYAAPQGGTIEVSFPGTSISSAVTVSSGGQLDTITIPISSGNYSELTVTDTSGTPVYIQGAAFISPAPQIQVYNGGIDGLTAAAAGSEIPGILAVNPKLVLVDLGINDILSAGSADLNVSSAISAISASISVIATSLTASGAEVVLVVPSPFNTESYAEYMPQLQQAYQSIASSMGLPLIDLSASYGDDYQALNMADLLSGDVVHPNATFYADIGAQIAAPLTNVINGLSGNTSTIAFSSKTITGSTIANSAISAGAMWEVGSGGMAANISILNGGTAIISSGGSASSATLSGAAGLFVSSGGSATATTLSWGGGLYIVNGGVASDTTVLSGGAEYVDGGQSISAAISAGGSQIISSGGAASAATVNSSGEQIIETGGSALFTTVQYGGLQVEFGTTSNAVILNGGFDFVEAGGIGISATINNGGYQYVYGTATNASISAGGTQTVEDAGAAYASLVNSGGTEIVSSGGTIGATTLAGGTLDLQFGGNFGPLTLSDGGVVDLLGASPSEITSESDTGGTLSLVIGGTETFNLAIPEFSSLADFSFTEAPSNNALQISIACFCAGTRIATPHGEVPIEQLKIGDEVLTKFSGPQPIKFIGRRDYNGRFIAGDTMALPVRIAAGALAPGRPARELWLSPGHALLLGGALVPAWRLINGVSVTQASSVSQVSYFHIELAQHGVIFADACPAESFCDVAGLRNQFQNAAEFAQHYPGSPGVVEMWRTPLTGGYRLAALQRRINRRAGLADLPAESGELRGYIDEIIPAAPNAPGRVSGWAQDVRWPEMPVELGIFAAGKLLKKTLANHDRADLRMAGIGRGAHGFTCRLPRGTPPDIEVLRIADRAALAPTENARQRHHV